MIVGALQYDTVWEDPPANFERLARWIERAAASGVRLLLLPEMFSTGFSMATDRIAEPPDGPSSTFLSERARDHGMWIAGSVPERADGDARAFNALILAGPDGERSRYRKIHPFTYSGEHEHYAPGEGFVTATVDDLRVTLFVCYDLRFADEFWATAADTDCYLVPANWPVRRRHHWTTLLRARAIENQAFVVGCNRVGTDGNDLEYVGDSLIVDPWGEILASAAGGETLVMARADGTTVREARERFPVLQDRRRPETLRGLVDPDA